MREQRELAELVQCINGKIIAKKDPNKPYVGLEHIPQRGSAITEHAEAGDSISTNSVFQGSDVLFGKLRPNLRKCVLAKFDGYCSTDILVLRALPGTSSSYAVRVLQSEQVGTEAEKSAVGTKMPRTSWASLKNIKVFAPPIVEQRQIAQILDTLDTQIQKTEALITKLEKIKEGLLHDLLTRGIDQNGQLRPTPEQAPELYKESALGFIPKEWHKGTISNYLLQNGGIKPGPFGSSITKNMYRSRGYKIYGQEQVIRADHTLGDYYIDRGKYSELIDFSVQPRDILISLVGTVGKVLIIPEGHEQGIINPRLMRLRPNQNICDSEFLSHVLTSIFFTRKLTALAGGGTMPVKVGS